MDVKKNNENENTKLIRRMVASSSPKNAADGSPSQIVCHFGKICERQLYLMIFNSYLFCTFVFFFI